MRDQAEIDRDNKAAWDAYVCALMRRSGWVDVGWVIRSADQLLCERSRRFGGGYALVEARIAREDREAREASGGEKPAITRGMKFFENPR